MLLGNRSLVARRAAGPRKNGVSPALGRRPVRLGQRPLQAPYLRHPESPRRPLAWTLVAALLLLGALGVVLVAVGVDLGIMLYRALASDLPSVAALPERPVFKTTQLFDRHGTLLYEIFDQEAGKRTVVPLSEIPPHLIAATIATEDAGFFSNPGIEPRGILRAAWANLLAGRPVAGGSTISQQLVKNVLLPPEERYELSLSRKLREALLAFQLSRTYSKEQILEMYLNEIYYGNLAYGVEAAARTYFAKPVHELTLAEAAMLAGLPQAPAVYDPFKNPQAAKARQSEVLDLMVKHGLLDPETAAAAKAEPLRYATPGTEIRAPHFVMYVRDLLAERYGQRALFQAGFRVYTTLDLGLQQLAEEVVSRQLETLARQDARNAGLVALDPRTGEILAMVGSPDFYDPTIDGQVNATLAERQPGSAIKPLVYLAAFQRGFGPATVVLDQRTRFPDGPGRFYTPDNFDRRFRGPVTLRQALGNSLNIPAVKVLQFAGLRETVRLARTLGLTSLAEDRPYGLSFTLGGVEVKLLELAGAYAALANGGRVVPVDPILRIEDSTGQVVYERPPAPAEPQIDPRLAFLITDILADNDARRETFGANSPLRLSRPAAVKTGSTDDYRDSWTIGYTPSLLAGVWVGNSDGRPMRAVLGSSGAGQIWHEFMERALAGQPAEPFIPPEGLIRGTVCADTGYLPGPGCQRTVTDWFLAERPPRAANAPRARVAINTRSNKLATAYCPLPEIAFRTFGGSISGEGPYPPTEYCDLHGPQTGRPPAPWDTVPTPTPTVTPSPVPPTPVSSRIALGPTLAPLPTWTPLPPPTATPPPSPVAMPTVGALPRLVVATLLPSPTPWPTPYSSYHPWAHLPVDVALRFPTARQPVDGTVVIIGSAAMPYFERYTLQYGAGEAPTAWEAVAPPRTQPVQAGVLETWDTSPLPDGLYTLVLSVQNSYGEQVSARQLVQVHHSPAPESRRPARGE